MQKKQKGKTRQTKKNPELIDIENRLAVARGGGCGMDEQFKRVEK